MKQINYELDAMRKAEKRAAMELSDKSEKERILEVLNTCDIGNSIQK